MTIVRVVGLEGLRRKLGQANFERTLGAASIAIAKEIENELAPYPPLSIANSPSQRRWYERSYGPRWRRADGSIGGIKSSERMDTRWAVERVGSIGAKLANTASYAAFVHDDAKQAKFHGARGWKTDKWAVDKVIKSGEVENILTDAVRKALR